MLLGSDDRFEVFHRVEAEPTLFGGAEERVIEASIGTIGRYFNDRLKSIFAVVAERSGVLRNAGGSPLVLLCFAASNAAGAPIALKIANHLLKDLR